MNRIIEQLLVTGDVQQAIHEVFEHDHVKAIVHDEYQKAIGKAREAYGHIPDLPLVFSTRPTTRSLGSLRYNASTGEHLHLKFPLTMLSITTEAGIRNTVGHEVAHHVQRIVHHPYCQCRPCVMNKLRRRPMEAHGEQFRDVMKKMGYNADFDTPLEWKHLPNRTPFHCACQTHYVGKRKGANIVAHMAKGGTYSCNACRTHLQPGVHPKDAEE